jgi:aryl sulfotransferase
MLTLPGGVVWLASFPKSGNTWLRILLSNLLAGQPQPEDINNLSLAAGIASSRWLFENETLLDSNLLQPEEIDALRPSVHDAHAQAKNGTAFIKTHDAWTFLPGGTPLLGHAARAAVYVVRDPRDVAVSLAFFLATDFDTAIDRLTSQTTTFGPSPIQVRQRTGDWGTHFRSWLDHSNLPVLAIRYEDLVADTAGVLRRVAAFLEIRFETDGEADDAIARAVRHSDFGELQRQEKEQGFVEWGQSGCMNRDAKTLFFRQGKVGDWRGRLSEAQVHRIESTHASTMTRLGYETATVRSIAA